MVTANTPFFARNGLNVNNFVIINTTAIAVASNLYINTSTFWVGNATANLFANSTLFSIANSTGLANVSPLGFYVGTSSLNATMVALGANVFLDSVKLSIGNTSANLFGNSVLFSLSNSTSIANLTPISLTIGSSLVNSSAIAVGFVSLGGPGVVVGNSTVNASANSMLIRVVNATNSANLDPIKLAIGGSVVNSSAFVVAGTTTINTTAIYVGGGVVNAVWHAGNMGTGSTLDSDLLDGQHGAYYTAITTRLGYTPVNKAGDTGIGALTATSFTGLGSGLTSVDAITLQGHNAAFFQTALGFTPVNKAGDTLIGALSATSFTGLLSGDGTSVTNVNAVSLQGHAAAYFQTALGFTPVNKAGDTAIGALTATSFTGLGSGLTSVDAATLQTHNAAYFQAALGFTPVNKAGDSGIGALTATSFSGNGTSLTSVNAAFLGGYNAAYFQPALGFTAQAALGFTPINKAGDSSIGALSATSFTGILSGDGTNVTNVNAATLGGHDYTYFAAVGAGGVNAAFLEGHNSAYFQVALGFTPVNKAGDSSIGALSATSFTGTLSGDGTSVTNVNASLLGGHAAAYFQTALGFTPVNSSSLANAAYLNSASTAAFIANTASQLLQTDQVWAAAAPVTLTDGANVAVNLSTGLNFILTLGGNRNLDSPTNAKSGQAGIILVKQSAGNNALTFGANWKFPSGTAPGLSANASSVDKLYFFVESSSIVHGTLERNSK